MTELDERSQKVKEVLKQAVDNALEKKRLLGQYAIISKDGKPVRVEPASVSDKEVR